MSELEDVFSALALSARPAAINWAELGRYLQDAAPLSDRDRVRLLLDAANAGRLAASQWRALAGFAAGKGADVSVKLPEATVAWLRSRLQALLPVPAGQVNKALRRLQEEIRTAIVGRVVLVPVITKDGRANHVIADGVTGAILYGLWLAVERQTNGEGGGEEQLCRCDYSQCGTFFLKRHRKGPGAPKYRFCSEAHAVEGDREKARERMATKRRKSK